MTEDKRIELCRRDVERCAKELAKSTRAADRARLNLLQDRRRLRDARVAREQLPAADACTLAELDAWLVARRDSAETCFAALEVAEAKRALARARLVAARLESKNVERALSRGARPRAPIWTVGELASASATSRSG